MGRLLTDAVRSQIGREASYTAPEELGRAAIRYFALAIGDDNPLRTDVEHARSAGYADVVAPPTLICESNQYMTGVAGPGRLHRTLLGLGCAQHEAAAGRQLV